MELFTCRLLLLLFSFVSVPAFAVDRIVTINAPAETQHGSSVSVSALASTNAIDGEYVGFFHVEYSLDGGQTWTGICYEEKSANKVERAKSLTAGKAGSKIAIRVRAAFRGGIVGDVDFEGKPILWDDSWANWRKPPTRYSIIYVR